MTLYNDDDGNYLHNHDQIQHPDDRGGGGRHPGCEDTQSLRMNEGTAQLAKLYVFFQNFQQNVTFLPNCSCVPDLTCVPSLTSNLTGIQFCC